MIWKQKRISLEAKPRGFHLVTREVFEQLELSSLKTGMLHLLIQHTSASLTLNENASADVRRDFERFFRAAIPDNIPYFEHTYEGLDDMTAHIKASLLGHSLMLPLANGSPVLGTWQGIYLGEHREQASKRSIVATWWGTSD